MPGIRVSPQAMYRAKIQCQAPKSLPDDWADWFPAAIPLKVPEASPHIRIGHVRRYAELRLMDTDPYRFIEAAQCLALIHYLGCPPEEAIIETRIVPAKVGPRWLLRDFTR